jgi:hypothetical protein
MLQDPIPPKEKRKRGELALSSFLLKNFFEG